MTSCLNEYEKNLIGEYILKEYTLKKKQTISTEQFPRLTLNSNKTFSIVDGKKTFEGKWEAGDDGDRAYIHLLVDSAVIAEGRISGKGGEIIDWFHCYSDKILSNYSGITFIKNKRNLD
ncbi:hypothetical protein GCM10028805_58150 [Spirosoma harenae]